VAISCVYCGGNHADPSGVRACWQRATSGDGGKFGDGSESAPAPAQDLHLTASPLGRNVIVGPGQQAPPPWHQATRRRITMGDLAGPGPAVSELRAAALARRSLIIELDPAVAAELAVPQTASAAPSALGARFEFGTSTLQHLVLSNAVDATDPQTLRWPLCERALQLGASVVDDGRGDVALADGTRVWLDGGPMRFTPPIDGVAVLHRVAVEHGSLTPFGGNETSAELASDQLAAVLHEGGAARIIAPAGSGKTRVLTERARHLLIGWRIPAGAVCLVAFNKRAQQEMRERTSELHGLQVRTLNAIALAIVNGTAPFAPQPRRFETIDEREVRRIIAKLVSLPRKRNADPIATWIEALSLARLGLRPGEEVEALYAGDVDGFADVLPRYRRALEQAGQLDFDEQVQRALEVLLTDPVARAAAQRACRIMLVDEFQDLTPAHVLLVRLLAGPDGTVFGVGDDDQTIYGYNGADPGWLIDFAQLFPGAGDHPLEVNYRCPSDVVAAAQMLLRHNARRVPKNIRSNTTQRGLVVEPAGSAVDTTVRIVRDAVQSGTPTGDVAVLTRVNSLLVPVQVGLGQFGIGTTGGVGREFTERTAVRAALAWLRLATTAEPLDADDLAEALRRPSRPMHPNIANWVAEQRSIEGLRRLAGRITTERDALRVGEFTDDIERLQRMARGQGTTAGMLGALRDSIGLGTSIASLDIHRRGMNRAAQNDDLTAIAQLAELQPDPRLFESWLRDRLSGEWQAGGVTLATVHRVKGQEWPLVVVHQADDDQFPHRLADDIEEERRVFHVAITRAGSRLHIVADVAPSPFIADLTTAPSPGRQTVTTTRASAPNPKPLTVAKPGRDLTTDQTALFERLRTLRRELAADIAVARPVTSAELARIKGVGPAKLDQYGAAIVAAVEAFASPPSD
jgi:DNA helicase-2/ATP-dependent DNA helicase PcrA